jgi:hypothetical protein
VGDDDRTDGAMKIAPLAIEVFQQRIEILAINSLSFQCVIEISSNKIFKRSAEIYGLRASCPALQD